MFVNRTPHVINVQAENGTELAIPPSNKPPIRIQSERRYVQDVGGVPCFTSKFTRESLDQAANEICAESEESGGSLIIVPALILNSLDDNCYSHRCAMRVAVAPDSSPQGAIRNEDGVIVGVKSFQVGTVVLPSKEWESDVSY